MKESISYTFVLNIVILFIFICFAIILGIFSYYRAFKAGVIIVDSIEKYEGYNCLSAEEIGKKLSTISYNVPFDANCNKADGSPCMVDANKNYAVISYNLRATVSQDNLNKCNKNFGTSGAGEYHSMNTKYCDYNNGSNYTKEYQYGVVTYMYVDLPVVSNLLKLTVYSKTRKLYEFRDLFNSTHTYTFDNSNYIKIYDTRLLPKGMTVDDFKDVILNSYAMAMTSDTPFVNEEYNSRTAFIYDPDHDSASNAYDATFAGAGFTYSCGKKIDYSLY